MILIKKRGENWNSNIIAIYRHDEKLGIQNGELIHTSGITNNKTKKRNTFINWVYEAIKL